VVSTPTSRCSTPSALIHSLSAPPALTQRCGSSPASVGVDKSRPAHRAIRAAGRRIIEFLLEGGPRALWRAVELRTIGSLARRMRAI
jgi:hypothetical protein